MLSSDQRIDEFTKSYMEKIFYFCLKKTGSIHEAKDLSSDISLCVFTQLRKGTEPINFPGWVWQIARNRYANWAKSCCKKAEFNYDNVNELALAGSTLTEDEYLHKEDLSLLRRELAFIASDYRNIIVAYYIEDQSVQDIAASLHLPKGTVMSKLFRARTILKKGMMMAREFGSMSYKPEDVGFIMNGVCSKYGEPWLIFSHKLNKNILLAAYRTPSTAEELAVELGVALPYMEDELEKMTAATLLRKNGNKYETNIFIVSADAQERIYGNLQKITPALTNSIISLLEYETKCLNQNCPEWNAGYQPYQDAKWALLMRLADRVRNGVLQQYEKQMIGRPSANLGRLGHTIRPNGGEWDLLGLEDYTGERPAFVGLHGCIDTPDYIAQKEIINFGQFKFQYKGINNKTPEHISYDQAAALKAVVQGNVSDIPQPLLETLVAYGYLKFDGNSYTPTFLVIHKDKIKPKTAEQELEYAKLYDKAVTIGYNHYMFCRKIICAEIPDFFKKEHYQIDHACANMIEIRGAVLEEALHTGYISYAESDPRNMLGAYLSI